MVGIDQCKPLHCEGHVTGHSTTVQDPIVPPRSEWSEPIHKWSQLCLLHQTAWAPTDQDMEGPEQQSWDFGDGKYLLLLPGMKPRLSQQFSPITTVTELSQILYLYMPCRHTQQHRYTSTHLTSALDGGKRSASVLSSSMPRSPWYLLNKRLGWIEYNLFFLIFQFVSYLSTAQYNYRKNSPTTHNFKAACIFIV